MIANPTMVESIQEPTIIFQKFALDEAENSQLCSKEELVKDFTNERIKSSNDNYKLMEEIIKTIPGKNYLLAMREADSNVFWIATNDKERVSQVRIHMDKVGLPDKINFHKQALEIMYSDLLKSYLSKSKLEEKVIKLEEQVKREKAASNGWKT